MSQNSQDLQKFQKFQLDNHYHLVDFEKCCQTRIYLQNFVLMQPKTSEILPKFCKKMATNLRVHPPRCRASRSPPAPPPAASAQGRARPRLPQGLLLVCDYVYPNLFKFIQRLTSSWQTLRGPFSAVLKPN